MPKEARDEIRSDYAATLEKPWQHPSQGYLRGRLRMAREIFGSHNLTSDTEPEEAFGEDFFESAEAKKGENNE